MANCYLCDGNDLSVVMPYRAITLDNIFKDAKIVKCNTCGLLQIDRHFTDSTIEKYYKEIYNRSEIYSFDASKFPFDNLWSVYRGRALAKLMLEQHPKQNPTVMDLGCGYGHLLFGFQNHLNGTGKYIGVEYDDGSKENFNKLGWEFIQGGLDDVFEKYQNQLDILITSHVFEHVIHPVDFLNKCAGMLKADGILLWEVPNLDERNLKCESRHSPHICLWDIHSLNKVLTSNNFEIIFLATAGKKYTWYDQKTPFYQFVSKIAGRLTKKQNALQFKLELPDQIDFHLNTYGTGRRNLRVIAKKCLSE